MHADPQRKEVGAASIVVADASSLALTLLGDTIGANLFLVGVAAQRGLLPVSIDALERAIALNGVAVEFNLKAFRLGRLFAADPKRVSALIPPSNRLVPPQSLGDIVAHRATHLRDYQDDHLAERYRALIKRVEQRESEVLPGSDTLALAAARNYAKLLAYKDEYEVARLLTQPDLRNEIQRAFADGGRIAFNMAPPILARAGANGRPKKREFGTWIVPVLHILARSRRLRGKWLDPFAHTAERRTERALISEYEALVEEVLGALTAVNHGIAVTLLSLADEIRGFGPVKVAAIEKYRNRLEIMSEEFRNARILK